MSPTRTYYELKRESRITIEKFFWHWSILAGGTLTLLVGYLKDISPLPHTLALLFRWGLVGVLLSLILAPLSNLFSSFVISRYAHLKDPEEEDVERLEKSIALFSRLRDISGVLAILVYCLGLILITYVFMARFL